MPVDALYDVKNSFYIGNYQACINESQKTKVDSPEQKKDLDVFMYRSYLAQKKYALVMDELARYSGPEEVKDLRLLVEYLNGDQSSKPRVVQQMEKKLSNFTPDNTTLPIVAATIYMHERDFDNALKTLYSSETLESMALSMQCYLQLDRIDMATKEAKRLMTKDEDATLTQLCNGWLNLNLGGEKLQEAFYIFQELSDKNSKTPLLCVGLASVLIAQGKHEEADAILAESLEKDPNHVETVINQIVVSQFMGKSPEVCTRLLSQLKNSNVCHPFVLEYQQKEQEFQQLCASFSA